MSRGRFVVVIGTQWGDEGKGKIVDLLTEDVAADRKSTRLNSSHVSESRMPSSA